MKNLLWLQEITNIVMVKQIKQKQVSDFIDGSFKTSHINFFLDFLKLYVI